MKRRLGRSITAALLALLSAGIAPVRAAQDLPILSGRWSTGNCVRPDAAAMRDFGAGVTSSANDRCSLTIRNAFQGVFHVHLACRYRQAAAAEDDVVLKVNSPTSLDWIDECTAIRYSFCGKETAPDDDAAAPR